MSCEGCKIKKGNSANLDIPIYEADGITLATNLATTIEATWQLKKTRAEAALLEKKKTAGEVFVNTPATGWVRISLLAADTDLDVGSYFHGLRLYWAGDISQEIFIYVDGVMTDQFNILETVVG